MDWQLLAVYIIGVVVLYCVLKRVVSTIKDKPGKSCDGCDGCGVHSLQTKSRKQHEKDN